MPFLSHLADPKNSENQALVLRDYASQILI
jgi:hypothetical protein